MRCTVLILLILLILGVACKDRRSTSQSQSTPVADSQAIALTPTPTLIDRPIDELIDSLRFLHGNFGKSLAVGSFDGQLWLSNAILAKQDSAVLPLLECMSRSDSTGVTWQGTPLSLGPSATLCFAISSAMNHPTPMAVGQDSLGNHRFQILRS